MSHDGTERTKLGPGFDVPYISGVQPTTYHDDAEMEDTASSSPQLLGETIPESPDSLLGLTHSDVPAEESTHSVTGLRTVQMQNQSDADPGSTVNVLSDESNSNPGTSGIQCNVEGSHQQIAVASSSGRSRPKSPLRRALSPKRTQSTELRARFARLHQGRLFRSIHAPANVQVPATNPAVPSHDTISRSEADATLAQLQQQISDTK